MNLFYIEHEETHLTFQHYVAVLSCQLTTPVPYQVLLYLNLQAAGISRLLMNRMESILGTKNCRQYCCWNKHFMFLISPLFLLLGATTTTATTFSSCSALLFIHTHVSTRGHKKRSSTRFQCRSSSSRNSLFLKHRSPSTRSSSISTIHRSKQDTMNNVEEESTVRVREEQEQEEEQTSDEVHAFRSRYWKDSTFLQNDLLRGKYEEDIQHLKPTGIDTEEESSQTTTATTITCMHSNKHGNIVAVQLSSAITERQAAIAQTLASHIRNSKTLHDSQFVHRSFGDGKGGNDCTYLAPIIQAWSPEISQQIVHIAQQAYDAANWQEMGYPPPTSLGIRTSEHLSYQGWKSLEGHKDVGSMYTCMIALKDPCDYEGGEFFVHKSIFDATDIQPDRLSAVVFLSDTIHGVRPITSGIRETFVTELWENDDSPLSLNRPTEEQWEEFLEGNVELTLD